MTEILENSNATNSNLEKYVESINTLHDKHCPIITRKFRKHRDKKQPWMTSGILTSLNRRDKLNWKKHKMSEDDPRRPVLKAQIDNLSKILRRICTSARNSYITNLFQTYQSDIKKTWHTINTLLSRKSTNSTPEKLNIDGTLITDKLTMANAFNDFFSNVGPNLAESIPHSEKHFSSFLKIRQNRNFLFTEISPETVINIIKTFNAKTSVGCDGFSNKVLKSIKEEIATPLSKFINQSFSTGIFPDLLKKARVVPIFKKGDETLVQNYRPISILPALSKIYERAMHDQITSYLDTHQLLNPNQYGFRADHSTELASTHLVDKVISRFDKGFKTVGIFMDLSKAFDTLDHRILITKLARYGFAEGAITLMKSYLTNRKQFVQLDNVKSNLMGIKTGVPQGSILGPLLFSIYINDLSNACTILDSILYADDTTLTFSPNKNVHADTLSRKINKELESINQWFCANKLSLNIEKTKFMLFHRPRSSKLDLNLRIAGTQLEQVKTFRFLGLTLNEHMTWSDHITVISLKISKIIGIMRRLRFSVPKTVLSTIYNSLILPHLNFQILSWGKSYETDKLAKLQKRAVRTISRVHYRAHTTPLFIELKFLKFEDLYQLAIFKFLLRYEHNKLPKYFDSWRKDLRRNQDYHHWNTRNRQKIASIHHRNNYFELLVRYQMVGFKNSMSETTRLMLNTLSIETQRINYKKLLLGKYEIDCNIPNCYVCLNF